MAIVVSWVLYVELLFGIKNLLGWMSWGIVLIGLWILVFINLVGVR